MASVMSQHVMREGIDNIICRTVLHYMAIAFDAGVHFMLLMSTTIAPL